MMQAEIKKFLMSDISKQGITIDRLEVQSFEMNVYLVKLTTGDTSGFVYNNKNTPMRFFSAQQIRDLFEECKVTNAAMVQDSSYDEMIGNPNKPEASTDIPFSMQQPY